MHHIELDVASIEQTLDACLAQGSGFGLLALLPEAEKERLPLLQAACRERGIPLVGGIFPALIVARQFVRRGAWLLVMAPMPCHFLIPALNSGDVSAAEKIAAEVRRALSSQASEAAKPTLFLAFDSMVPNIASILDDLYLALANRIEYAGVNVGSETFQAMPCLFDESRILGDGVLGLLLPGDVATSLAHGFTQPERAMSATSTEGNRVAMIDWRPAFEVYQEVIKAEYGIDLTAGNFYQYAVHYPFGILRANGDVVVRFPVALADDGALFCIGEVPENTMLVLLKSPAKGSNDCVEQLTMQLQDDNGCLAGKQLLTFYCAGRRMHFGDAAENELALLHASTAVTVMAGALSLGEIGSTSRWGYPMFHNATLVCRPWLMR